jgi:hypothetical protein
VPRLTAPNHPSFGAFGTLLGTLITQGSCQTVAGSLKRRCMGMPRTYGFLNALLLYETRYERTNRHEERDHHT